LTSEKSKYSVGPNVRPLGCIVVRVRLVRFYRIQVLVESVEKGRENYMWQEMCMRKCGYRTEGYGY
jgi:hypothetical protein